MINRYLFYFTSVSLVILPLLVIQPVLRHNHLEAMESDYDKDEFYEDEGVHESQQSQDLERDIYQQELDVEKQTIQTIEKS